VWAIARGFAASESAVSARSVAPILESNKNRRILICIGEYHKSSERRSPIAATFLDVVKQEKGRKGEDPLGLPFPFAPVRS
jgi:hypothetical protein